MDFFQVFGIECNKLRSGIMGMGRKGGIRENYDGLCKMII